MAPRLKIKHDRDWPPQSAEGLWPTVECAFGLNVSIRAYDVGSDDMTATSPATPYHHNENCAEELETYDAHK